MGTDNKCELYWQDTRIHVDETTSSKDRSTVHRCTGNHTPSYKASKFYHNCYCGAELGDDGERVVMSTSLIAETAQRKGIGSGRDEWLDVMARLQNIRDEIMREFSNIKEALNGHTSHCNCQQQEPDSTPPSVVADELPDTTGGETKLEFALRTEAEVRAAAYRARSTPTEPPPSYSHDIG